ncbi:MAG: cell division protein FtsZ [Patescibacteria group bacterium]|jgi:cell division protein FtsZ|nr:cell division protein FtsZ [Patescibacteria group bacterium]
MAQLKPSNTTFAKIKVVGVGGGGSNAVDSMITAQKIQNVEFVAVNTDAQALLRSQSSSKLQIGSNFTKGLGSGGDPLIGEAAAQESKDKIRDVLHGTELVFLTAGMGGGTGTGASPVIAKIAQELGALVVAVVTKPFEFEGSQRMTQAEEGIDFLIPNVDAHIVVPNQKLVEILDDQITLLNAFKYADRVLGQGVQGISDLITIPGMINADFADVKNIMTNCGSLLMGLGEASGEDRATKAATQAVTSPLLELTIEGAQGLIFNITAGSSVKLSEITAAAKIISERADKKANIIFGHTVDDTLSDKIKITVIATGFRSRTRLRSVPFKATNTKRLEIPTYLRMATT